ncbi:hypothetical protein MPTK1_8g09550 [Marchantia polymorpha subsp. ruderalis]|uniref:Uncharacterized protein n=1 Tax=Marchantia polymorpha TaxID=3197 RepID=A0A2R6XN43_MARPO|nr:hypothetical protein MARPO_0008s0269 [Marchantia polymorpha]BBN19309.1 hypothetical protein Mp_8g09550 [Marchantia polymorpha subsp. ruderalis]|eukprot:PTQ47528.1 hypothetical protein MARPO_0008s0269 [Marchantia polymorpha]
MTCVVGACPARYRFAANSLTFLLFYPLFSSRIMGYGRCDIIITDLYSSSSEVVENRIQYEECSPGELV